MLKHNSILVYGVILIIEERIIKTIEENKLDSKRELDDEPNEKYNIFVMKYRELKQRKRHEAHLLYYESELLYILVDHFKKPYEPDFSKYKFYDLRRFPRKKFHMVLMDHPIVRNRLSPSMKTMGLLQPSNTASASFTNLIKRIEKKGWLKRIRDGKKLYLKITEEGMKKIKSHYEYHVCGII